MKEHQERFLELAAAHATGDLSPNEYAELTRLEHGQRTASSGEPSPDSLGIEDFDAAAAAIELAAWEGPRERLSADLVDRVMAQVVPGPRAVAGPPPGSSLPLFGWFVAAAAAALALLLGLRDPSRPETGPRPAEERLAELRLEATDLLEAPWSATEDPLGAGASGSVYWSPTQGQGFMRFKALPSNDPARHQYQLWIFDATRPAETPVDGGVFDIPSLDTGAEVVVPIDPKIRIDQATLFAVTLERPGGVVVSERERLLLTAAVPQ